MEIDINSHSLEADNGWGSMYYDVIPSLINKFGFTSLVEVGVAFGGHLDSILEKTKIEKVYGVDSYFLQNTSTDSFSYDSKNYIQSDYDNLYIFTKQRLSKYGKRVDLIRKSSIDAAKEFEKESLDIVFIDAEHTYNGVKQDLETWEEKIRISGVISGHDYDHPNFPGVKKAVDEWCNLHNYKLNVERGYVWWIRKI
jgi:hypothetical protein